MNRLFILTLTLICHCFITTAQEIEYARPVNTPESCTSIMVGKKASTDGSVMTSHTCDGNYRTWMDIVPAATYDRDTTVAIYNGRMHTEYPNDQTNVELKETIPQALLPLPERKTTGDRGNYDLRTERTGEQERHVHDRRAGKDRPATLLDRP